MLKARVSIGRDDLRPNSGGYRHSSEEALHGSCPDTLGPTPGSGVAPQCILRATGRAATMGLPRRQLLQKSRNCPSGLGNWANKRAQRNLRARGPTKPKKRLEHKASLNRHSLLGGATPPPSGGRRLEKSPNLVAASWHQVNTERSSPSKAKRLCGAARGVLESLCMARARTPVRVGFVLERRKPVAHPCTIGRSRFR